MNLLQFQVNTNNSKYSNCLLGDHQDNFLPSRIHHWPACSLPPMESSPVHLQNMVSPTLSSWSLVTQISCYQICILFPVISHFTHKIVVGWFTLVLGGCWCNVCVQEWGVCWVPVSQHHNHLAACFLLYTLLYKCTVYTDISLNKYFDCYNKKAEVQTIKANLVVYQTTFLQNLALQKYLRFECPLKTFYSTTLKFPIFPMSQF